VKFAKRVAVCLVLCFAAYGAYALLKRPPQLDIPESDIGYLEDLGIHIQETQADSSGRSPILNDVEGVAPIGASPFTGSSTPPSFLVEPTTSSIPPPFMMESAPRVAEAHTSSVPVPGFFVPTVEVLPPPSLIESEDSATPSSPGDSPFDGTSVEIPSREESTLPWEVPPIPITESPPPWTESWDGPASDIPVTAPPLEILQTPYSSPNPIASRLASTLPPASGQIIDHSTEENIRRIESTSDPIRIPVSIQAAEEPADREYAFSSSDSVPLDVTSQFNTRYTLTTSRQPLTFEPVKPEPSQTAPMVAFAPPKRIGQPDPPQQPSVENTINTASLNPGVMSREVKPIDTLRHIDSIVAPPVEQPSVQPTVRDTIEQFVQAQRRLIDSGEPENVRQAFIQLSQLYELEQLDNTERAMMQPILDRLALRVIYAREMHLLEPPYRVKPGETVESIAKDFNLTPTLLRKINGLAISQEVSPGMTLKVVYGQFDARVSIQRRELTLLLGGLYAGRFAFSLPNESISARKGEFYVTSKRDRTAVLNNGWVLATAYTQNATIAFTDKDAREIFDILSEQSVIVVE